MATLPPHLRQYVTPGPLPPAQLQIDRARYAADHPVPPPPLTGPKPQYDYRHMNQECQPVNVHADPGAIGWPLNSEAVEYVDRPQIKLQRTFGRDGKRLFIEGNTVHHPTGRQRLKFPVNGREADNFLRRMTGHDPHRRAPGVSMLPSLMPDNSLGPNGEWGDSVATPAISLEDRAIDALNEMNIDTLGNSMLPFIRPDIHQWREQPVSYKKPTPHVRGPIIEDTRAGIFYQANPIGRDPRFSEPLPTLPGTPEARRRPESMEHMQLPREQNKDAAARAVMSAPVPQLSLGSMARADQTPFEDVAHRVLGAKAAPLMLTAIKRYHRKLQRPHSLDYGAGVHDGDDMASAFDALSVGVPVRLDEAASRRGVATREQPLQQAHQRGAWTGGDGQAGDFDFNAGGVSHDVSSSGARASNRLAAGVREQPLQDAHQHGAWTGGDGEAGDYDVRREAGVSIDLADEARGAQRDGNAQQREWGRRADGQDEGDYASSVAARGTAMRQPTRADAAPMDAQHSLRGALSHEIDAENGSVVSAALSAAQDVRQLSGERPQQRRNRAHVLLQSSPRIEPADELMDGRDAIGSIGLSNRRGNDDRALRAERYDGGSLIDPELSSIADRAAANAFGTRLRAPREPMVQAQQRAGAHLVPLGGADGDLDSAQTTRAAAAQIGDILQRLQNLEQQRSAHQADAAAYRARTAAFSGGGGDADGTAPADHVSVANGVSAMRRAADARVADARDWARNAAAGVVEYDSASAAVAVVLERERRPASAPVLRDERQSAGRGLDEQLAQVADAARHAAASRVRLAGRDASVGSVRDAALDSEAAGDASFGVNPHVRTRLARNDRPLAPHPERSAFASLAEGDAAYGAADAVAQRYGAVARDPRRDALTGDLAAGGYSAAHEQFEPSAAGQRVETRAHAPLNLRREASVAYLRRDNPDSDALTSLSRATTSAPQADAPHARFADREERMLNDPANYFRADEMHNTVNNEMRVAPEPTHLGRVHERLDAREASVPLKLRGRLRHETPPPATHMERNARFGRMLSPCPSPRRPASVLY